MAPEAPHALKLAVSLARKRAGIPSPSGVNGARVGSSGQAGSTRASRGSQARTYFSRALAEPVASAESHGKILLMLLAVLAFIACVSFQHGAQASVVEPWTEAQFAADGADEHDVLGRLTPAPARFQQDHQAPPSFELKAKALEADDTEDDAQLHLFVANLTRCVVTLVVPLPAAYTRATEIWIAEFSTSAPLARGPPV